MLFKLNELSDGVPLGLRPFRLALRVLAGVVEGGVRAKLLEIGVFVKCIGVVQAANICVARQVLHLYLDSRCEQYGSRL